MPSRSWRTPAAGLLRRLGYVVTGLGPGAVMVARRPAPRVRRMAPGTVLVTDRRRARRHWVEAEKALSGHLAARHLAGVLELYRVNCVLDVGANRGQFARRLRAYGYRGRIVSFEPVPATFAVLAARAARDGRWSAHPFALGDADGTTTIRVVPGTMSSVLAPTAFGAQRYGQFADATEQEVPLRRLDGLLDEALAGLAEPRPFLKLDTQGYDLQAFAGLGERTRELVGLQAELALMEIYAGMPRLPEALATYEAAGLEVSGLFPVSRQAATARMVELDCVMVRAEAV
jgi:FkbM family methyltransferase